MATWVVERTQDRRFPFRITIEQGGRTLLAVRAQNLWPGAEPDLLPARGRSPTRPRRSSRRARAGGAPARLGRKLSVTLDRAQRKRCEFLKIEKPFKDRPGA